MSHRLIEYDLMNGFGMERKGGADVVWILRNVLGRAKLGWTLFWAGCAFRQSLAVLIAR